MAEKSGNCLDSPTVLLPDRALGFTRLFLYDILSKRDIYKLRDNTGGMRV